MRGHAIKWVWLALLHKFLDTVKSGEKGTLAAMAVARSYKFNEFERGTITREISQRDASEERALLKTLLIQNRFRMHARPIRDVDERKKHNIAR